MENYGSSAAPAIGGGMIIFFLLFYALFIAAGWKIFTKAGKPGWACIIPIYNIIVLLEIVGKPLWWVLLILFPCTYLVFGIWTINLLSKSFGKDVGFTLGLIFLGPIFVLILAFGDAVYLGPSAKEAYAANRFGADDYQKPFDQQS